MALVSLKSLLQLTPMDDKVKNEALVMLDEFGDDEKFQLEKLCWETLADVYSTRLQMESEKILEEVRLGKRKYNVNDFTELQAKMDHEFADKLEMGKTEEEIAHVRSKLQEFVKKPVPIPTSHSLKPSQ